MGGGVESAVGFKGNTYCPSVGRSGFLLFPSTTRALFICGIERERPKVNLLILGDLGECIFTTEMFSLREPLGLD